MPRLTRILFLLSFLIAVLSLVILALRFPALAIVIVAGRAWCHRRRWRGSGGYSHGTARLSDFSDLTRAGWLPGDDGGQSLIMGGTGYIEPPTILQAFRALLSPSVADSVACRMVIAAFRRGYSSGLIRISDFVHLLTVAPAGAGKSVCVILMNLFYYRGACCINDPSGELWRQTAWFREKVLGHRCIRIDPFGLAGPVEEGDRYNTFDSVDENSPDFIDQVRDIADAIVLRDSDKEPHFNERATDLIAGMSAFVCALEGDRTKRNLAVVADILSSRPRYEEAMRVMQETPGFHGVLQTFGHQLTWLIDRELGSVVSTVHRQLSWLLSPRVAACLSGSTFDPRMLWSGRTDVYIIVPHDRLTPLAGLLRLLISSMIHALARHGDEKHKVLFMLDEIGHCGRIRMVEDAITLWRKSGIRIWLFVQSLDQLKKCYGERADTVIDNLGTQQYFGINNYDTGEALSKRCGDLTQIVETINVTISRSKPDSQPGPHPQPGSYSSSTSTTLSESARKLFFPDEILVLPSDVCLLFHNNMRVALVRLVKFFTVSGYQKHGTGREKAPGIVAAMLAIAAVFLLGFTGLFVASVTPPAMPAPDMPGRPYGQPLPPPGGDIFGHGFAPGQQPANWPPVPVPPLDNGMGSPRYRYRYGR